MTEFEHFCPGCGDPFPTVEELKQHEEDHEAWSTGERLQVLREWGRELFWCRALGDTIVPWTKSIVGWRTMRAARMPVDRYMHWRN